LVKRRRKTELSEDQVKAFFQAIRNLRLPSQETDNIIFTLIQKYGFKPGEVVGVRDENANVPGIHIKDIVRDRNSILVHKVVKGEDRVRRVTIEPHDMERIFRLAGNRERTSKLFDGITRRMVYVHFQRYAREAKIRNANPEALKRTHTPPKMERQFHLYLEEVEEDIVDSAVDMADFYVLNFCIENAARRLISETLVKYGKDWWEKKVSKDIQDYVNERRQEELDTPLDIRSSDPLDYTTFGQLKAILNANWSDFTDKIRSPKSIDRALSGLNELRHVIAHSGTFTEDEKLRFDLAIRDWRRIQT